MKERDVIQFINYTKKFNNDVILDNINISFKEGGFYGIVGRNGSGKSVLFKAICGFIKPTVGDVKVNDITIGKDIDFPDGVGALIEKPGFLPNYSGFKNLEFLASINNKIGEKEISDSLKLVGLPVMNDKSVKNYSLGMKQRLGIAQAIMEDPDIIILDEPMNGLDKDGVKLIKDKLKELHTKGKTIIISSHIESDIEDLCDKVFKVECGSIELIN